MSLGLSSRNKRKGSTENSSGHTIDINTWRTVRNDVNDQSTFHYVGISSSFRRNEESIGVVSVLVRT